MNPTGFNAYHRQQKWDSRFLNMASLVASWSKDPSIKVGAVIVDPRRRVMGHGYNGFAHGCHDHAMYYADRNIKYKRVIHAEVNAILNANAPITGCTLYSTFHPCCQCAAIIVQAGITEVVYIPNDRDEAYKESFEAAQLMFAEAGVRIRLVGNQPIKE